MSDGQQKSKRSRKHRGNRKKKNKESQKTHDVAERNEAKSDSERNSRVQSPDGELERNTGEILQCDAAPTIENNRERNNDPLDGRSLPRQNETAENVLNLNSFETIADIQRAKIEEYSVESPKQTLKFKDKKKLQLTAKSKSLDDDCALDIVEVTELDLRSDDEKLAESCVVISEAESDLEGEDKKNGNAIESLHIAPVTDEPTQCQQTPMSPQEEINLRNFLHSLNLTGSSELPSGAPVVPEISVKPPEDPAETENEVKLRKARKKAALEEHFLPQIANPRFLDVIDEEGSNESGESSRRQSILNEQRELQKRCDDIEEDILILENNIKEPKEYFPKPKSYSVCKNELKRQQECLLVGAKIVEADVEESCGGWKIENTEVQRGADIVYLDDSSSGTTSEAEFSEDFGESDLMNDEHVTIKTPTIELNSHFHSGGDMSVQSAMLGVILEENGRKESALEKLIRDIPISVKLKNYVFTPPPSPVNLSEQGVEQPAAAPSAMACNDVVTPLDKFNVELLTAKPNAFFKLDDSEVNYRYHNNSVTSGESNTASLLSTTSESEVSDTSVKDYSSGSVCSSHSTSHSTAKYNPTSSSLTDIVALVHDDVDIFGAEEAGRASGTGRESNAFDPVVAGREEERNLISQEQPPDTLRELCVARVASLPYGKAILEELAAVSQSLEQLTSEPRAETEAESAEMQFYPTTDLSVIKRRLAQLPPALQAERTPPPVTPRQSSFRVRPEEVWSGLPCRAAPQLLACLSPAQRRQLDRDPAAPHKDEAAELIDMHCKYADRRGYHETSAIPERPTPTANNINDEMANAPPPRAAPPAPPRAANRLLAIVRDPVVNLDARKTPIEESTDAPKSTFHFAETLRTFEDLNSDVTDDAKRSLWVKKSEDGGKESLNISERYTSDRTHIKAVVKKGNPDDTDFSLKAIRESMSQPRAPLTPFKEITTFPRPALNGTDSSKSREHIIKVSTHYNSTGSLNGYSKEDANSHVQRLQNKRAFLLDDPIFEAPVKNDKNVSQSAAKENGTPRRRCSLPKDLHERQMEYIIQKEKEIQEQIRQLEEQKRLTNFDSHANKHSGPRAPMLSDNSTIDQTFVSEKYHISRQGDIATIQSDIKKESSANRDKSERSNSIAAPSDAERFRDQMYNEYMGKVAEREERKQHKVIKITNVPVTMGSEENLTKTNSTSRDSMLSEIKHTCSMIEDEFITKAKERWDKLGFKDPETEDEADKDNVAKLNGDSRELSVVVTNKPVVIEHKIKVLDGDEEKDVGKLPNHLQEFVKFTGGDGDGESKKSLWPFVVACSVAVGLLAYVKKFGS